MKRFPVISFLISSTMVIGNLKAKYLLVDMEDDIDQTAIGNNTLPTNNGKNTQISVF